MAAPKSNPTSLLFTSASSQYVTIPNNAAFKFSGAFTIEFSLKTTATGFQALLAMGGAANSWDYQFYINGTANKITFDIRQLGVADSNFTSSVSVNDGHWHHIAGGRDGSGNMFLYVDGVAQSGSVTQATAINSTGALTFGVDRTSNYYNGNLNNIRFWNVARTANQIADRAKDMTSETGLVAWWRCKDTTGTTLTDVIGGFNGTLTNSPTWSTDVPFTVHESTANSNEAFNGRFMYDPRLVSLYRLENTSDSKGSNTLTNNGGVAFNPAKYNNGADLGASNTTKYLSVASDLGIAGNAAMSVSIWFKAYSTTGTQVLFNHSSATGTTRWFQAYISSGSLVFDCGGATIATVSSISASTWYHLVFTRDASGNGRAYLNGVCVGTGAGSTSGSGSHFYIGVDAASHYASIIADDVGVYNSQLNDADAMDLYIGKKVSTTEFSTLTLASDPNFIDYYKLEDTSDSKGVNTLTNTGTTTFTALKFNNGANFGASNTTKYLRTTATLGIDGGAMSSFGWVKMLTAQTGIVVAQSSGTSKVAYLLYVTATNVQIQRLKNGVASDSVTFNITIDTATIFHLGFTYDGTVLCLYLNGELVGLGAFSGSGSTALTAGFNIGSRSDNNGDLLSGIVDDVPVFNRALTPDEVALIFYGTGSNSFTQTCSETITISDTMLRTMNRLFSDSLTITDSIVTVKVIFSVLTDGITITDVLVKSTQRTLSDSLTISDTLIKNAMKTFTETLSISDTIATVSTFLKVFSENITIAEYFTPRLNGLLALWHRVTKTTGSWTKKAKDTTQLWTKIGKQ